MVNCSDLDVCIWIRRLLDREWGLDEQLRLAAKERCRNCSNKGEREND